MYIIWNKNVDLQCITSFIDHIEILCSVLNLTRPPANIMTSCALVPKQLEEIKSKHRFLQDKTYFLFG